ncbi:pfkB carbohydrate kinase family protein [Candidatus Endolissoclinum faulkneri L2]|uniref:PfkB carbohydrate kinase family protein n=1 Tax=Candidatus Endolissoclinum faulkneri L2 TaxID=1193729 RepID=K7ZCI7_9PROT|nr:adenosine kinase [Candidatus Endolissoclinum faulkneri]AFX98621.1 pfkB carbohydrate kinase family protein [Candidatus Endolissoclinum faulkneri L2]
MIKSMSVVAIGNAIVDIISHCDDDFLLKENIKKGAMTLIDAERLELLYAAIGPSVQMSGGSASNTAAGLAALGSSTGYIGKVRDDKFGRVFRQDIIAAGVHFDTSAALNGPQTACSIVLVTPDKQRSMSTFLGACVNLIPDDISEDMLAVAQMIYLEGYLWDQIEAQKAFFKAIEIAHRTNGKIAMSLSDSFCVERYRADFKNLVKNHVDILFANEIEALSLFETDRLDDILDIIRIEVETAVITRGEKGAIIVNRDEIYVLDAEPVANIVDSTGAGDLYAAGFLHGYTSGKDVITCGRMGMICASEIISHIGARPETDLKMMLTEKLT